LLKKFASALINFSRSWIVLAATVLFLLFGIFILPNQSAAANAYSGEVGSPDLSLFYSANTIYQMAEQYGQAGRDAYIRARFSFDLIFPLVYGFFLITGISWFLGRFTKETSHLRLLTLTPIVGIFFDFLENISASIVINRYPAQSPIFANLAPIFTLIKWVFVGGSFLVLIISGLFLILKKK
jgi:hypothetical protein